MAIVHWNFFFNPAEPPLTAASLQWPLILSDSPYTDSCLNHHGHFLLPQGGRCVDVQLAVCQLIIAPSATPATDGCSISGDIACTQTLFHFSFRSFGKHGRASLRSRRLKVVGERENGRARGRHASLLLARPFFLVPTTSKRLSTQAIGERESEAIYILSHALYGLWRENRGSVNRLLEIANQSDCLKHHDYWVYIRVCWRSMRREIIELPQLAIWWVL